MVKNRQKGIYLIILTAIISGLAIFINKFGVNNLDPFVFTGLKNSLVAVFLSALLLTTKQVNKFKSITLKNWIFLILIGLFGGSIPFLLFFKGLSLTTAPAASFIHKNMFLLIAVLAPIILKEKVNKNFFIIALLLVLGNSFLLNKAFPITMSYGNILIFMATFFWALENIIAKKVLKLIPPETVAWARMFFGSLIILLFLFFSQKASLTITTLSHHFSWILITSMILLAYVLTWYQGLKYLPVTLASFILTLGLPITLLLSLSSQSFISVKELMGIILIILAVVISTSFVKKNYYSEFKCWE